MRSGIARLPASTSAATIVVALSAMTASITMNSAAEPNVEGTVTIAGGPCGAQPKGAPACRAADETGEGVRLVFAARGGAPGDGTVTAGGGGRYAIRLAPGEYELRLASGQGGALRYEARSVRVPATGKVVVDVRLEALRP